MKSLAAVKSVTHGCNVREVYVLLSGGPPLGSMSLRPTVWQTTILALAVLCASLPGWAQSGIGIPQRF
jgi:hypothetical protein